MDFDQFKANLKLKIQNNSVEFGRKGCIMWVGGRSGAKSPQYGRLNVKFPNEPYSKKYYTHRLAYMLGSDMWDLPNGLHVSHRCHFSLCVNFEHLSLEPQSLNNERQMCGDICSGHKINDTQFPDCILWYFLFMIY
jgi:hypothetical protein